MSFARLAPMLQVVDVPESIDFYTRVLGFRVVDSFPAERPTWAMLERGAVELIFTSDGKKKRSMLRLTGVLHIRMLGVLALHAEIAGRAKVLWGPGVYSYGMREFAIEDVNGYTLSFGEPTNDPPTAGER